MTSVSDQKWQPFKCTVSAHEVSMRTERSLCMKSYVRNM
jgi:hypothetical protein